MNNIDIRTYIKDSFKEDNKNEIKESIEDSIKEGLEEAPEFDSFIFFLLAIPYKIRDSLFFQLA